MAQVTQRAVNKLSLRLTGGEDFTLRVTVTQVNGGAAQDLTGAEVWLWIKRAVTDADAAKVLELQGDVVSPASGGLADIVFTSAQTTALEDEIDADKDSAQLVYDVWVKDAAGKRQPVVDPSTVTIRRGVYQPA